MASLTVPPWRDPVISCMRGGHVGWTTPQGQLVGAKRAARFTSRVSDERSTDEISRRGLLFPLKPVAVKWLAGPKLGA